MSKEEEVGGGVFVVEVEPKEEKAGMCDFRLLMMERMLME